MPFFAPLPDPEPDLDEEQQFFAFPGQEPEHVLPGSPAGVTLYRDERTAIHLVVVAAYPQGLALEISALRHPDTVEFGPAVHHRPPAPFGGLRFGAVLPDGERVDLDPDGWFGPRQDSDSRYCISGGGGGGGGLSERYRFWLWPLPPPGAATAYVMSEAWRIPETATAWDLTEPVGWAGSARQLWTLLDPPEDGSAGFGWTSFGAGGSLRLGTTIVTESDDELP